MSILAALIGLAVGWVFPQPAWVSVVISLIKKWWEERKAQ